MAKKLRRVSVFKLFAVLLMMAGFALVYIAYPHTAYAQGVWVVNENAPPATFGDLRYVLVNGIRALFAATGLASFAYLIFGGFRYITAGADPKAIDDAQKTVMWAVIGFIFSLSAIFLLRTLSTALFGIGPVFTFFDIG